MKELKDVRGGLAMLGIPRTVSITTATVTVKQEIKRIICPLLFYTKLFKKMAPTV